jgi:hypothetical protein
VCLTAQAPANEPPAAHLGTCHLLRDALEICRAQLPVDSRSHLTRGRVKPALDTQHCAEQALSPHSIGPMGILRSSSSCSAYGLRLHMSDTPAHNTVIPPHQQAYQAHHTSRHVPYLYTMHPSVHVACLRCP